MRILIADDNATVRRGVALILSGESGWEICGEASDGEETLQKARELKPNLVVIDMRMPKKDGLETSRLLAREFPDITIIMMSQYDPLALLPSAKAAGASACVDKGRLATDLIGAVKAISISGIE